MCHRINKKTTYFYCYHYYYYYHYHPHHHHYFQISVVNLLTRRHQHVDLFQKDSRGRTPLHLAAHYDFAQCAKAMVCEG